VPFKTHDLQAVRIYLTGSDSSSSPYTTMNRFTPLLCFCLAAISYTLAFSFKSRHGDFILHEKRPDYPDWKLYQRLESHVNIPLRIGLKQQNLDSISDYLMAVADPDSPTYGQHWSQEEVVKVFAPSSQTNETVHAWLMDAGFDAGRLRISHNKAWIDVHGATAMEVESLLNTEYHIYKHDSGAEHVGGYSYMYFSVTI
jgi:tripeptidyl-peptidase-1